MPKIHQPNSPLPIRPSVCPDCLEPTRFLFLEPDERRPILHAMFLCSCGRISAQVVVADTVKAA
jgi:hypothetical protein